MLYPVRFLVRDVVSSAKKGEEERESSQTTWTLKEWKDKTLSERNMKRETTAPASDDNTRVRRSEKTKKRPQGTAGKEKQPSTSG